VRARADPTHILTVEVPLDLSDRPDAPLEVLAAEEALRIVLALSRAAFVGALCGGAQVTLREA
jgi:hypothetical protein